MLVRAAILTSLASLAAVCHAGDIDPAKVAKVKVKVVEQEDRFTGTRGIGTSKELALDGTGLFTTVSLKPAIVAGETSPPSLYMRIAYSGRGWVFLTGEVDLLINGTIRHQLKGSDSSGDRNVSICNSAGCINDEIIRVPIDVTIAEQIAGATTAEIRARGTAGHVEGALDEKHAAYFAEFARRYRELVGSGAQPPAGPSQPPALAP